MRIIINGYVYNPPHPKDARKKRAPMSARALGTERQSRADDDDSKSKTEDIGVKIVYFLNVMLETASS